MKEESLHPSPSARADKIKNGAVLPTNSYMMPPKGGPMRTPNARPPRAIPMALPRSRSSGYRSANIPIPGTEERSYEFEKFEDLRINISPCAHWQLFCDISHQILDLKQSRFNFSVTSPTHMKRRSHSRSSVWSVEI